MSIEFSLKSLGSCNRGGILFIIAIVSFVLSNCSRYYLTFRTTKPPVYYLGKSPKVRVVNANGATDSLQEIVIRELKIQSKKNGYFTIDNAVRQGIRFDIRQGHAIMTGIEIDVSPKNIFIKFRIVDEKKIDR